MSFCEVVETKMFAKFVGIILYFFLVGVSSCICIILIFLKTMHLSLYVRYHFYIYSQTTHGKVIGEVQDVSQSIEEYGQIAPLEHTDEEIIAATTFMTLAPVTTDSDKIKDLMVTLYLVFIFFASCSRKTDCQF